MTLLKTVDINGFKYTLEYSKDNEKSLDEIINNINSILLSNNKNSRKEYDFTVQLIKLAMSQQQQIIDIKNKLSKINTNLGIKLKNISEA